LWYLKKIVEDLRLIANLVQKYDYAVSGDTSIEEFVKMARNVYGEPVSDVGEKAARSRIR